MEERIVKQTIVTIGGVDSAGKTTLFGILRRGDDHLLNSRNLKDIGLSSAALATGSAFVIAKREGLPLLPLVERAIADKACLVIEGNGIGEALLDERLEHYNLFRVCLVAPRWLISARRRYRLVRSGWCNLDTVEEHPLYTRPEAKPFGSADVEKLAALSPETVVFLSAEDLPLKEASAQEAEEIVSNRVVELSIGDLQYQRALRIGDEWHGNQDFVQYQSDRFDKVLPSDMTGMDMIDVGANNGAFCFEAINRGALYAVAVERDQEKVDTLRHVRDARRLPITIAQMNLETEALPRMRFKTLALRETRYSLALLLNVLHHVQQPEALLRKVMAVSDAVVAETPPVLGSGWPQWIYALAEECGFTVEAEEEGSVKPESRRLFRLERVER